MNKRKNRNHKILAEALEASFKLQDIYEHVSDRESVFVEIPSKEFFVPRMTDKEIKDFEKTGLHKFYRGVYPNVIYVDNKIAFPVSSSLLQPYYQYLRYLVSTQVSIWAYAIPLTSKELSDIYKAVFGESIGLSDIEEVLETLDLDESLDEESPISELELGPYEMGEWMDEEAGGEFDREIMKLFEDKKNVKSIYFSQILSPSKKFFQSYFEKYPAGKFFRKGDESLYGRVPVLSGHTGIAKSAFVKKLEDHTTNENLVSVNFGDGFRLQMRPEVVIFKTGSVAYRELEEAVFAISKVGGGGAEYLVYQTPFFEKFFRASDQFRFFARKALLSLIKGKTENGKEIPPELRVVIDENGMAIHEKTGVALEDKDSVKRLVKEGDRDLKVVSLIYDSARPAVLFLDELDRNHALMVRNLTTSFIFNRSFQDELTFYSTYIIAAWNRVAPSERESLSSFYITAKTASSASVDLEEKAFMARFEEVYLDPSSEEVYRPIIEYLVSRFEGRPKGPCEKEEKLCGVREFLEKLARTEISHTPGSKYNLLYYIPGIPKSGTDDPLPDESGYTKQLLSGFATFRSYERLLKYLSKKKAEKDKKDRIINMTFVKTLLGYLFPATRSELDNPAYSNLSSQIKAFGKAFAKLVEDNLGYNPYNPGELEDEYKNYLYERSSDAVLRESVYSGTPVALYGPPGLAKTSKAEALVWKLNEPLFDNIRRNEDFRKEVVKFLRANGYQVSEDPEEVITILATKVLVMRVGSELMSNPNVISGSNAPMPLATHPIIKGVMDLLSDANGDSVELDALRSLVEESVSSIVSGGEEALVKHRVPRAKVVVTEKFLSTFKESRAVLILDEFTRANFVTQGSFFDALSERIIGGHIFPEDAFERVQVVATGNYSSSLFGTSVSEIDGALVARFANFFQEEPSMVDIDSYLRHLVDSILKTVNQELADPKAIEELRSYVLGDNKEEETDLRDLLYSMFAVSGRADKLREFMDWLKSEWASTMKPEEVDLMINAPFPSPREVSHFFLNRLLPLWLPQSAKLSDQDSGFTYDFILNKVSGNFSDDRAIELAKNIEKNKVLRNPYILAKRIFQASLGVIPRYPVPGISKSLFHPFSGAVFIPEPTKEVFPKLHEALSKIEEAKELFNLDYQRYDSYFGGRFGGGSGLRIGDKDYNDHPFYLADSYVDIERTLGRVSWDKLAEEEEVEKEVVFYSKLMVLAAAFASGDVYDSILDLVDAVKKGKAMFFPGYTKAYKNQGGDDNIEKTFSAIWENAKSQAEEFIRRALEIYRRYCNIKLSEALSTKTKKVITGDRVFNTLRRHLENVKKALRDNYVVDGLESLYEKISSRYRKEYGEINNLEVYSRIASEILYELDRQFADEYKIYIENARVILNNIDPDEEPDLHPKIQEALEYVRLITGPGALANLVSGLGENPESDVVKEILEFVTLHFGPSPEGIYHVSLSGKEIEENVKDYLGDPGKVGHVESELSKYVTKKFDPIRKSLGFTTSSDRVYSQKLDPNVPFIPKMGIVAPGNPTLYGGVPLVPSLEYQDDPYAGSLGVIPSFLRSSLLNVYYYDRDTKILYLVGINIPYLVKDMSFTKDSERVVENKEVFLIHKSKMRVVFANGLKLEIETFSKDPVEPFAVKAAEEVVQSEEFSELMEQAKHDPYATSLLNEVQLLAGKVERLKVFSSSNPKESVDHSPEEDVLVELPSESIEYWIKANNYLLSYEGRIEDMTLQAVRDFVRSQKYLERYLSELALPSISDTLFGGLDKDMADFGNIDFGDDGVEDTKDLKKTNTATPQKAGGVKGKSVPSGSKDYEDLPEEPSYEEEPGVEGTGAEGGDLRGSGRASVASRRNAFTYITLLRRAINLARQSISRSV
jgi:MoxR-like ATPase/ribosomal protein L20A (L18A)